MRISSEGEEHFYLLLVVRPKRAEERGSEALSEHGGGLVNVVSAWREHARRLLDVKEDGGGVETTTTKSYRSLYGQPRCFGCVGVCALWLGRIAHARSVVFCQPITALTCTGQQRCPKVTPWERFQGSYTPPEPFG